jgi:transposase
VIDYETFCKIHDCHDRQGLTIAQTARFLGLDPRTVTTWVARPHFTPRSSRPRKSLLDPFKPTVTRLLDTHPYSAQQIFQRLREQGYQGGITILRDYVRRIRPTKLPVYLKLAFAAGECAQVDWRSYGTVTIDDTQRRLSFFVMVLAYSRQMYVEFSVSQTMEHFLTFHQHAFGYVKKNFLRGLELAEFTAIQAAAKLWLDTIANVRIHHETRQRPDDLLVQERPHLKPLNPNSYDCARTLTCIASSQFRIRLDSNRYTVPSAYAHRKLTVKAWPDRICIYFDDKLIARHIRRWGRNKDYEDKEHSKELLAQRHRAREQRLLTHFLTLSPDGAAYYEGLEQRRFNARQHLRKILALAEIYSPDQVARAISDGLAFEAFSAEYIANILEARTRALPEPGPLQLTRRQDLLDLDVAPPDLNEVNGDEIH